MTIPIDWNLMLSAAGVLFLIGAAMLKNFANITATTARSKANEERLDKLEADLHSHQILTISTYVTNATLKEAMLSFGVSIDRLTDRLDRIISDKTGTAP